MLISFLGLAFITTIFCAYGHAAFESDLQISGVGVIEAQVNPFGIENLQEMTPTVCAAASTEASARLKDQRDGKMYWVTKLRDGSCWMNQNLDLEITQAMINGNLINSTNTDINTDSEAGYADLGGGVLAWNNSAKYPPTPTYDTVVNTDRDNAQTSSFNPGDYLYAGVAMWSNACRTNLKDLANCSVGVVYVGANYKPDFSIVFAPKVGD